MQALIVVNASGKTGIGDRGRWVARAAGGGEILFREGGRLRTIGHFIAGLLRTRPPVVYAIDSAAATVVTILVARVVLRSRVIMETGEATAALARSTGRWGWPGFFAVAIIERLGYALAHTIVVRGYGHGEILRESLGRESIFIPEAYDPSQAGPREGKTFRRAWGASEDTVVVGVRGSATWVERLQWCYGRDVIEVVARADRPDLLGVVAVKGDGLPHLERLARRLGVQDRVRFVEPLEGDDLWEQLGGIDIGLSTQTNDLVGRSRTTTKLVQYLAAGKFILASRVGTAAVVLPDEMLVEYHGAWDESYFDRLARRIETLPDRPRIRARGLELIERAREFTYLQLLPRWGRILAGASS
jgi:hypothetical protein